MQTCRGLEGLRVSHRGLHDVATAHAIADRADAAGLYRVTAVAKELEDRAGVGDDHTVGQLACRLEDFGLILLAEFSKRSMLAFVVDEGAADPALPVIEVRHRDVVADRRDATRQVMELFADSPDIHVENDRGKWAVLFRVGDERLHASVGSGDFSETVFHGTPSPFTQRAGPPATGEPQKLATLAATE